MPSSNDHPEMGPFDPDELVQWAETYGHPEEWAKKAQAAHARAERLAEERETCGDLEAGAEAFWAWFRDHLSVEACEAVENEGVHPKDWQAAAECCIRAARGERDSRPFTTYPDLPR